jgi:16S rRNA (adenine1518-N6/adenine1519-N6)-dimethyltransferase
VVAIEKDETMIEILKETLKGYKHIEVIGGDILKLNPMVNAVRYKLVANIPYYLTSPLIRKFLEAENKPDFMVLMVQKEVAQRICAKVPDMSLLAVSVQFYAEPKIISYVSKNCFWPAPKVDSAIIKIIPQNKHKISADLFFEVVKAGFSQPRKQLAGNLSKALKLEKSQVEKWLLNNNISPKQRAETLYVKDWKNLAESI